MPGLISLHASGNAYTLDKDLCQQQPNVQYLDFSHNFLHNISKDLIKSCKKLTDLKLSNNYLTQANLYELNITNNLNLQLLNLSHNHLNFLPHHFLLQLEQLALTSDNLTVDLTGNPLLCGCEADSLLFTKWFTEYRSNLELQKYLKFQNEQNYICSTGNGIINLFHLTPELYKSIHKQCTHNYLQYILIALASGITATLSTLVIAGILRFKWRIKYMCFKLKNCLMKCRVHENQRYRYDAFVSYCAEDRLWVHDVLMKTLEQHYGFKLFIHYRDFPVGEDISAAIIEAMRKNQRYHYCAE